MWRANSLEKIPTLGKIEGRRRRSNRGGWTASLTQWTWVWANSRRWWRTGKPACCSPWDCRVGHYWSTEQQIVVVGKGRNILIIFSDHCGYSSLALHQNLTNISCLFCFFLNFYYFLKLKKFFFKFWLHSTTCGISVPGPGIEPQPTVVKVPSPNH